MTWNSLLTDAAILDTLARLKDHYQGFQWESQLWARWGHRRSPYRALMLFGLSSRTKDSLLVSICRRLLDHCPGPAEFLGVSGDGRIHLESIVRNGQIPFLTSAAKVMGETGGEVPDDRGKLMQVKGIGEKISECIMGYAWGREALPVDGNVCRVLLRLSGNSGTQPLRNPTRVRQWLMRVFSEHRAWMSGQGIALIDIHEILRVHAQLCCHRDPDCARCPVSACGYRRAEYSGYTNPHSNNHIWDDWRELLLEPSTENLSPANPPGVA